jgi:hypothetical protein
MVYKYYHGVIRERFGKLSLLTIALLFALVGAIGLLQSSNAASNRIIYSAIEEPLPPNQVSLGYQATQTSEFGQRVVFDGNKRKLESVIITMSSWACENGSWNQGNCETTENKTFSHPITLNIYEITESGVGNLLHTTTQEFSIPYRPSAAEECNNGAWYAEDGNCYNGLSHNIVFNVAGVEVPDQIIYGVAYNTRNYGNQPIGITGAYDSLNVGLNSTGNAPYVGERGGWLWNGVYYPSWGGDWANRAISAKFITKEIAVPKKVTGINISADGKSLGCYPYINKRDITVSWNADDAASYYKYQADANKEEPFDFTTEVYSTQRTGQIRDEDGTYNYRVRAVNSDGVAGEWSEWCGVTLDRVAPVAEIVEPEDGKFLNGPVKLVGKVTDANPMNTHFDIKDASNKRVASETKRNGRETHEFNWDTTKVPDGEYTVFFETRDKAGNKDGSVQNPGASVARIDVTVDNSGPQVSDVLLNDQAVASEHIRSENCEAVKQAYPVRGQFNLSAVIEDELSDVESATYRVRKMTARGCTQANIFSSRQVSLQYVNERWVIPQPFDTTQTDADGLYTIQLTTRDTVGNQTTRFIDIDIDNTKPIISIQSPVQDRVYRGDIDFIASVSDANLTEYRYAIRYFAEDGSSEVVFNSRWLAGESFEEKLLKTWDSTTSRFGDGKYRFIVLGKDKAGNEESLRVDYFYVDNTAPVITFKDDNQVIPGYTLDLDATVTDNFTDDEDIELLWSTEEKPETAAEPTIQEEDGNPTRVTVTESGDYVFRLTATDEAGNSSYKTIDVKFVEEEKPEPPINGGGENGSDNGSNNGGPTTQPGQRRDLTGLPPQALSNASPQATIAGAPPFQVQGSASSDEDDNAVLALDTGNERGVSSSQRTGDGNRVAGLTTNSIDISPFGISWSTVWWVVALTSIFGMLTLLLARQRTEQEEN